MFKIDIKDKDGKIVQSTVIVDGSGEPDPDRVISETEKFYDKEIAPVLAALAKSCTDRGMTFAAAVEYNYNEVGSTIMRSKENGFEMEMVIRYIQSQGNFDRFVNWLRKAAVEKNVDNQSIYLKLMELQDKQYDNMK